jgi:hypothetical protein
MKFFSYRYLAAAAGIIGLALPANADLQMLTTDRSWSINVQADGGPLSTMSDSTLLPGKFLSGGNTTSTNTGDGSVFGDAAQNSTTPLVHGDKINGIGTALIKLTNTVTAADAVAKSVMDVTFTPTANTSFDLFAGLVTAPNPAFLPSMEFKLEDTTTNTSLLDLNGPTPPVTLNGTLTQGDVYRVFASVSVDGTNGSHSGTGSSAALGAWVFRLTEVPEPGSLALLGGCGVAGVFAWRRRRI